MAAVDEMEEEVCDGEKGTLRLRKTLATRLSTDGGVAEAVLLG